jgi:hypothetical protein
LSLERKLTAEPTSFSERKAASSALIWRGAIDPPGSKSVACKQEFYRNLGALGISSIMSNAMGSVDEVALADSRGVHDWSGAKQETRVEVRRGDGNGAARDGSREVGAGE